MKRMGNTATAMKESGEWNKVGSKHYRHIGGIEVRYNCNRWMWELVGCDEAYTLLWVARHAAERKGATCAA
jgi:hypothetical protein